MVNGLSMENDIFDGIGDDLCGGVGASLIEVDIIGRGDPVGSVHAPCEGLPIWWMIHP